MSRWALALAAALGCAGGQVEDDPPAPAPAEEEPARDAAPAREAAPGPEASMEGPTEAVTDLGGKPDLWPEPSPDAGAPPPVARTGAPSGKAAGLGVGYYHVCLILPNLSIQCFEETRTPRASPPAGLKAIEIAASHVHNCVITPPGVMPRVQCFGGYGAVLTVGPGVVDPIQVSLGDEHACALNRDGSVICWGKPTSMSTPPPGLRAKSIAASGVFTCAITLDDSVTCWGANPAVPPPGLKAARIAVGNNGVYTNLKTMNRHACAVRMDGSVVCWGDDVAGEAKVPAGILARDVAVGDKVSCALLTDGNVTCWGQVSRQIPKPANLRAKAVRVAYASICAVREEDDKTACWGYDSHASVRPANGIQVFVP